MLIFNHHHTFVRSRSSVETDRQMGRQAGRQAGRQTDKQTDKPTDGYTHTDTQTHTHTHTYTHTQCIRILRNVRDFAKDSIGIFSKGFHP